ncbi:MAG: SpoIIE family protein phosphatase [Salinivirgaceae bacterium]|nr:SpoIIE family protein phosphatase [Salinivirgaceae bacterium]
MIDFLMAAKRRTTIFRQLILNVMMPPIVALLLLGFLNFNHTKTILVEASTERNYIIGDEIIKVLEFHDVALNLIESKLDERMYNISEKIQNYVSDKTDMKELDLDEIQIKFGMNPIMEDIYIINRDGIVINTTFEDDLGLDFFKFGEEHEKFLLDIFDEGMYHSERFAIENKTKRIKKFSYHPTDDGKYIIQIGVYSSEADEIIDFIRNTTTQITKKNESIDDVQLFIITDHPFSLNNAPIDSGQVQLLFQAFENRDTLSIDSVINKRRVNYQYIYMDRKNTDLYKGSVIRITSDRSGDFRYLRNELIKFISIFSLTLVLVILLIYIKTKVITEPIKKLVSKVNRITHGHLDERADISGNNEITTLSKQFNRMIEELESYYNELEQKVEERTREIQQQKEEISAQRDAIQDQRNLLSDKNDSLESANGEIQAQKKHIMDSIVYAQRIQNAILPSDELITKLIPNNFVYYKPKDIVSGDFYWVEKIPGKSIIAAVDCTGHGVPGAFMSIIGTNQLDYAVRTVKAKHASEILDALSEGVENSLNQENATTSIRDGMDISLCIIDYKNMVLEFAGAYNPLYLVRNGEFLIYKADKHAIGSHSSYPDRKYTNHTIELQKDDIIYIFSDGYPDQFGGPKGRKFMYKQFREYLLEISDQSLDEQKALLENKNVEWRGQETQVDDIIIIGIKI